MIYRMGAALMSLLGLFVSAYLYLYKIGRIGTLACGTGGLRDRSDQRSGAGSLGVEVALIGVLGYAALLLVAPRRAPAGLRGATLARASRSRRWPRAACSSPSISPTSSCSSSTPSAAGASARRRSS